MKRPQFSLRTVLWLVLLAALAAGWWADRRRLAESLADERARREVAEAELRQERGKGIWVDFVPVLGLDLDSP
jgi:hypothetical protein